MKLTDYLPITNCKMCNKSIFIPIAWTGLQKDGSYTDTPRVKTCTCPWPVKTKHESPEKKKQARDRISRWKDPNILELVLDDPQKALNAIKVLTALNLQVTFMSNGRDFVIENQTK